MADAHARVVAIVREFVGKRCVVKGETRLYHDLGISGDDAYDLLGRFAGEFHVSLAGVDLCRWFYSEPASGYIWLLHRMGVRVTVQEMSVSHLVRVAEIGRWLEPLDRESGSQEGRRS